MFIRRENDLTDRQTDRHYYAIDVLRVLLTFGVVLSHYWSPDKEKSIDLTIELLRNISAPTFFLLSFFLTAKHISADSNIKIKERIYRLRIPFFVWGVISWVLFLLLQSPDKNRAVMSLFWQLTTGHGRGVNAPLWYLAVLYVLTLLYYCIFRIKKQGRIIIIVLMTVGALVIQYTGLNIWLFGSLEYETRYPFGRVAEMIPYATIGLVLWLLSKKDNLKIIIFGTGILGLIIYIALPNTLVIEGFGYSGIMKLIGATSIAIIFIFFPIECLNSICKKSISIISAHTLGIYCLHYKMGEILLKYTNIRNKIVLCILIYVSSYLISAQISKIKLFKRLVD